MADIIYAYEQNLWSIRSADFNFVHRNWNGFYEHIINPDSSFSYSGAYGCFSPFIGSFDYKIDTKYFYVSFPYCRPWYRDLINQLNTLLKNIKIEILEEKPLFGKLINYSSWGHIKLIVNEKPTEGQENFEYVCPLLKITFDEKYFTESVAYYGYSLVTLLRMTSVCEKFITHDLKTVPGDNVLRYIIHLNNTILGYRTWTEYLKIKDDDILRFDFINEVNEASNHMRNYSKYDRQSSIIARLRDYTKGCSIPKLNSDFTFYQEPPAVEVKLNTVEPVVKKVTKPRKPRTVKAKTLK